MAVVALPLAAACLSVTWLLPFATVLADTGCTMRKDSTCICDMSDGSGTIDLTPISLNNGKPRFPNIKGYAFNPCYSFTDENCKGDVAVCQLEKNGLNCGKQSTAAFEVVSPTTPVTLTLKYTGGDGATIGDGATVNRSETPVPRSSIITLICQPGQTNDPTFTAEHPQYTYNFLLKTEYACPHLPTTSSTAPTAPVTSSRHKPEDHDISTGTILDIVFLLAVVIYFVSGMIIMRVRYQATGADLIPNRTFWKSLPSFIKSGIFFLGDGCGRLRGKLSSRSTYA